MDPSTPLADIQPVLEKLRRYQRTPKHLLDSWREAQRSTDTHLQTLVAIGFEAWVAYHVAKADSQSSDSSVGKSARTRIIQTLAKESPESLKAFGKKLAAAITADDDLNQKVKRWKPAESDDDLPESGDSVHRQKRPRMADRSSSRDSSVQPYEANIPEMGTNATSSPTQQQARTLDGGVNEDPPGAAVTEQDNIEDNYDLEQASLVRVTELFPSDLSSVIRRQPSTQDSNTLVASIKTVFPKDLQGSNGCRMVIQITAERIAQYAFQLFGIHVETRGTARYVHIAGGGNVESDRVLMLKDCKRDMILPTFGSVVAHAITKSPVYRVDEQQYRERTQSVSLGLYRSAADGGFFMIYMGTWEASRLDLYPSK